MRAAIAAVAAALALAAAAPPAAPAAMGWHSAQPAAGGGHPLLGQVGDLECWSANRCLLTTAGNASVKPGLFAYDGNGWYRYADVCGGHEGRIAWAAPDEFWTVADQQVGQTVIGSETQRRAISLCHFKGGQVVASYGEPLQSATSYRRMAAAACAGPSECWFGGERLGLTTSVNPGAFHLRWDGSSVRPVPSPTQPAELDDPGRAVSSLAFHDGSFYEGVDVEPGDVPSQVEEAAGEPSFLHRVDATSATPFAPLFSGPLSLGGAAPSELGGLRLTGGEDEDLWAVAGGSELARPVVLRLGEGAPAQLALTDPGGLLGAATAVTGVAAEAGEERIWVGFRTPTESLEGIGNPARLTTIDAAGEVGAEVSLPPAGETLDGEPVGRKGVAGALECTGAEQCWLATSRGWLFHLGADPAPQADPALHTLVTSRPPDNSLPTLPPLELPEDNSEPDEGTSEQEGPPVSFEEPPKRRPALLSKIKQKLVHGTVLELTFTLSAPARVWLVAKRKGAVVGKTKQQRMSKGRRSIRLRLDPDRWPTKLDLEARKLEKGGSR